MIDENGADKKAAKKRFHVLATSLEALSAIRRHCQDMEALFSDFHISDVGVGVVGSFFGHRSGRFIVAWACRACDVGGLLPELRNRKNPVNQCLQGVGDDVEVVGVSRRCRAGWLGFVARVDENEKKNTVNIGLHGYCSSPELNRLV